MSLQCIQDFFGGYVCFFMAVNAYMADVTDHKHRTKRVAFMAGLWPVGFNIGKALSGVIQSRLGFLYNFGIGMLLSLVAMVYVVIFVPESTKLRDKRMGVEREKKKESVMESWTKKFKDLFDFSNLKEGFRAVFRKRAHNLRPYLILLIVCFEMEQFINVGEWGSSYLYLRRVLGFTMSDFARYLTVIGSIGIVAQYITIPILSECFHFHDATIIIMDITGCFIQTLIVANVKAEWMLYLGACIAFLDYTSYSMIRCLISKYCEPDELGKILSVVGAVQAFIPIVSSPIFGLLYKHTVEILPQLFLLVLAGFFALDWVFLLIINRGIRRVDREMREEAERREKEHHMTKEEEEEVEHLMEEKEVEDIDHPTLPLPNH